MDILTDPACLKILGAFAVYLIGAALVICWGFQRYDDWERKHHG